MPRRRWTYETCYEEAKKYDCRGDFAIGVPRAYNVSLQNGWIDDYHWFIRKCRSEWTYDDCWHEALKYRARGEFSVGSPSAYIKARKNGWLDDYSWFLSHHDATSLKNTKWTYEACYNEAQKYHKISEFRKQAGGAYAAALKHHWNKEYTWLYKQTRLRWTYEACYNEARKYNSKWDFGKHCPGAYTAAREEGWMADYTWFEVIWGKWNRDTCYVEAKKYSSRGEYQEKNASAYQVALKNKWLDDYTWLENNAFNLYADKIDCVYVYEFLDQKAVYVGRTLMARKEDRDKEHAFSNDAVARFAYTHEIPVPSIKVLEENLTIREGTNLEEFYVRKYKDEGWQILNIAKTGSIGALGKDKWTKKACFEEAMKYKTKVSFEKNSASAYGKALKKGWLREYTWLKEGHKPNNYWTYERCYEEAKKYKTRTELQKAPNRAYEAARNHGWLDDYTWFVSKSHKPWTYETCLEESKKYDTRTQFCNNSSGAYDVARKRGWLDDFFPLKQASDTQLEIKWED